MARQYFLPFEELKNYEPPLKAADSVILFHVPKALKEDLVKTIQPLRLSITGILTTLIANYLDSVKTLIKPAIKTGRGNMDTEQIEKVKALLQKRKSEGVRLQDIASYVGCSNARARGLIDILSTTNSQTDFLVYEDCEVRPTRYYMYPDELRG